MNLMIFKFFFFLVLFICLENSYAENKYKNQGSAIKENANIEVLVEVLRGAGLSYQDASKAAETFRKIYPPERLNEESYLIMPHIGKEITSFAVNIDGLESVLVKKKNNKFFAYILSTKQAQKFIADDSGGLTNIDNIISLEKAEGLSEEKKLTYLEEELIFERGMTLLSVLGKENIKKGLLLKGVKKFSELYNPSRIKIGSKISIFRSSKDQSLIGFFIRFKSKKGIFVHIDQYQIEANELSIDSVYKNLSNKNNIKKALYYKPQVIRISLFNSPTLKIIVRKISKGSNLSDALKLKNISNFEANALISSLKPYFDFNKMKSGQKIKLIFNDSSLYGLAIAIDKISTLELIKEGVNFKPYIFKKAFKKKLTFSKIVIKKNLYLDSKAVNLPSNTFSDLVKLLSYSIDFQRDIRKGTTFEVLYESLFSYKGEFITNGSIIYSLASFKNKTDIKMFRFNTKSNEFDYFNEKGESIRKSLMRTPIDGARLSSGFGNRVHPILGYTKLHKGLDFAAKKGTPIYAAGNGRIERANTYGGYGRYIRIKHNSEYKTAYAHLYKFAKGIKEGKYVNQGDIIGYVGSSGRSTGPHLHYEVIYLNRQIDPYSMKLPDGKKLDKEQLKSFKNIKKKILEDLEKTKITKKF